MLITLKMLMIERGIRQWKMAVDLGWDPSRLSKIVNEVTPPTPQDRVAIAKYLGVGEARLFGEAATCKLPPRQEYTPAQAAFQQS